MADKTRRLEPDEILMIGDMIQRVFSNNPDMDTVKVCHAFLRSFGDDGYQALTASVRKTLMTGGLSYPTSAEDIQDVSEELATALPGKNHKMEVEDVRATVSFLMVHHGAPIPTKTMPPQAFIFGLVLIEAAALCLLDHPGSATEIVDSWNRIAPDVTAAKRPDVTAAKRPRPAVRILERVGIWLTKRLMRKIHNEYREPVTRALDYMNSGQSGDFIQALFEIDQSGMKEALRYAGTIMNVTLGKQRPRSDREAFDLSVEVSDYFSVWGIPLVASRLQSGLSSIWRIGPVDGTIPPTEIMTSVLTVLAFLDSRDHKHLAHVMDEIDRAVSMARSKPWKE